MEIISVFSTGEDVSRQVFAFSLANQYAALKKTLYIDLDIFQVLPELLGYKADKGLSEFIYFLKQNHPNIINKMNGIITKINNLDYIEGVSFATDLYELTAEDINQWLNEIMLTTDYEVIVFDIGCYFQAILELFRNTGQLLLLLGENTWEQVKYNNFKEQLKRSGYEDVLEKITLVPVSDEEKVKLQNINREDINLKTGNFNLISAYMKA